MLGQMIRKINFIILNERDSETEIVVINNKAYKSFCHSKWIQ